MPISGRMYIWEERAKYVPNKAGVYTLYNEDKVLIYIGGNANLREIFTHYLETNFSDDPRKRETGYYRREPNPKWKERLIELLTEYNEENGELPKLNAPIELHKKGVSRELGFHFYEEVGTPLSETALDLDEFNTQIKRLPVASLEFHQKRGDFARWIGDVFKETLLAERVEEIHKKGEDLRRELVKTLRNPKSVECPECGDETNPLKTWKMAGKPSSSGESLQLTIGFYKCKNCGKAFRKAIKKEKIKL